MMDKMGDPEITDTAIIPDDDRKTSLDVDSNLALADEVLANHVIFLDVHQAQQTAGGLTLLNNGVIGPLAHRICSCSSAASSEDTARADNVRDLDVKCSLEKLLPRTDASGLREDSPYASSIYATCRDNGESGLLLPSPPLAAEESRPLENGQIAERTTRHSEHERRLKADSYQTSSDTSEPEVQTAGTRNMDAIGKTLRGISESDHENTSRISDMHNDDVEEVVFCHGGSQEEVEIWNGSPKEEDSKTLLQQERTCGCLHQASDRGSSSLHQPEIYSHLKDEVHIHLKEISRAWESPSNTCNGRDDLNGVSCSEAHKNFESNQSGEISCGSGETRTFKVAEQRSTADSNSSPDSTSTDINCQGELRVVHSGSSKSCAESCGNADEETVPKPNESNDSEVESGIQESPSFRFFDELPRELFFKILSYFSLVELCVSVAPVCKEWYEYSKSPVLWQHLDLSEHHEIGHSPLCALLERAPLLKSLSLRGREQLCIKELQMLRGCPQLTDLNLGFCDNVNGRILEELVKCCPHLEVVNMEGCERIDDTVAAQFPLLPCLKSLNLSHCTKMTDDGVVLIGRECLLLEELNVDGIPWITDRAVKLLASERLHTLRAVYLDGAELTDASISYLIGCPLLHTLSLSFCEQLTDKTLSMLETVGQLRRLRLKRGLEFSDASLCHFFEHGSVLNLTCLSLSECSELMDEGVTSFARRCPRLRKLALCWCWNISDVGIEEIIQHCSQLEYLDIIGLDKVEGHCFTRIPEALPRLTFLDLRQCNLINDNMLVELVKLKPRLEIYNYYGEEVTPDMIL